MTNLALFNMGIASPTAIKKYGADIFKNPVGTGPYQPKNWVRNEKIMLPRNPNDWGQAPKIDLLIHNPVTDTAVRPYEL